MREGRERGRQRRNPLAWALQEGFGGARSGLAKQLLLRKPKEEGKQPGRDAVCPAVFTSPTPALKWPIVEIACSLAGLGRAAGQHGFTGPLAANPTAKNWASYLTLQRQHPFPSQGVLTNTHVVERGKKKKARAQSGVRTSAANAAANGSSPPKGLSGGSEELRAVQTTSQRRTRSACICLLTFQLSERQPVSVFV